MSNYFFLRRNIDAHWNLIADKVKNLSLEKWLQDGEVKRIFSNWQARQLAGQYWTDPAERLHSHALLAAAKANLDKCAFVGLTELFDESLLLLAHTFLRELRLEYENTNAAPPGRAAPRAASRLRLEYENTNAAPRKTSTRDLDTDVIRLLLDEYCDIDTQIYGYGKALYHQRFRQMIENLYGVPQPPLAEDENGTPLFNAGLRQVIARRVVADNATRQQMVTR